MTHLTTGVPPCVAAKKEERERDGRREAERKTHGQWLLGHTERKTERQNEEKPL